MLAICAERDRNVPAEQNARHLSQLKPDAETVVLPGLNHLIRTAVAGLPSELGAIEQTLSPAALRMVADWAVQVTEAP